MNATVIKENNIRKIIELLSKQEKMSKSDIARKSELSFPTITRLLAELCASEEVLELEEKDSTGGRNAALYTLNPDYSLYLLIAVDKVEISWNIKNLSGEVLDADIIHYSLDSLLEDLDKLIISYTNKYNNLRSIVVGFAAMVNRGIISENIWPGLEGVDLGAHFQNLTSVPLVIDNDMHIVALGQWHSANYKPQSSVAIYSGNTGWFGAGLIINGQLWKGMHDLAGEIDLLPSLKYLKDCKMTNLTPTEIEDIYLLIIRTYAALLNIEQVVLYQNLLLPGGMEGIRRKCYEVLPKNLLPNIEVSDAFAEHYEAGLFYIARKTVN